MATADPILTADAYAEALEDNEQEAIASDILLGKLSVRTHRLVFHRPDILLQRKIKFVIPAELTYRRSSVSAVGLTGRLYGLNCGLDRVA